MVEDCVVCGEVVTPECKGYKCSHGHEYHRICLTTSTKKSYVLSVKHRLNYHTLHEHRDDWIENRDLFYVKVKLPWVKNAVIEHTQDIVIYIVLLLQMLNLLR